MGVGERLSCFTSVQSLIGMQSTVHMPSNATLATVRRKRRNNLSPRRWEGCGGCVKEALTHAVSYYCYYYFYYYLYSYYSLPVSVLVCPCVYIFASLTVCVFIREARTLASFLLIVLSVCCGHLTEHPNIPLWGQKKEPQVSELSALRESFITCALHGRLL